MTRSSLTRAVRFYRGTLPCDSTESAPARGMCGCVIATSVGTSGNVDLFAFGRNGSSKVQLPDDPEWDRWPAVSPAGDRLAYGRSEGEFWPLAVWVLDLDL